MTTRAGADQSAPAHDQGPASSDIPTVESTPDSRPTRYRYLIAAVAELEGTVTIDQLVDVMTQWEAVHDERTEKSWHDVHEELYLVDLPTLDRAGLLEFDVQTGTVAHADPQ
jgi:hypothetical protein